MRKEAIRFVIVGIIATGIQYAAYWLLLPYMHENAALTVGYIVSVVCNFLMTTYFTFSVRPTKRRAGGFALSHLVNWAMQMLCLHLFVRMGISKEWAPIPMYMVCVPINFLMVRFFVKTKEK